MRHRSILATTTLALAAALSLAAPALAKEGGEAVLDAPVPRDAVPGTTIEIGWTIVIPLEGGGTGRMFGTPTYVRLVSPDGTNEMQAYGHETAPESGHYVATVDVPSGGIGQVVIALAGTSCDAAGGCSQSDFVFPIVGDSLTAADPAAVPPAAAAPGAAAPPPAASDAPTSPCWRSRSSGSGSRLRPRPCSSGVVGREGSARRSDPAACTADRRGSRPRPAPPPSAPGQRSSRPDRRARPASLRRPPSRPPGSGR